MKKILFTLLLICSCTISSWAQSFVVKTTEDMDLGKPCDVCVAKISYMMKFVKDTTATPLKPIEETMILEIGKKVSQFYSYNTYVGDSVYFAGIKNGLSNALLCENMEKYGTGNISWRLYKGINGTGTTTMLDAIGMERYKCDESDSHPKWKLCADTMSIIGYLCHKATTTFKGRKWTAWYTSDIPMSDGPWKLCGLPGLILKADDLQSYFSFEANGLEKGKSQEILYKGDKYEQITRKDLNKIYVRFNADPVGYMTMNPKLTITITDKNGNKRSNPKNYPYNPIEK